MLHECDALLASESHSWQELSAKNAKPAQVRVLLIDLLHSLNGQQEPLADVY
jgi:hypothetical protein